MPRTAHTLGELVRAVVRVDRSRIEPTTAARAVVAMAIPLVVGELVGQPLAGVTASIGALSGGFASFQGTYRSKAGWVMAATGALALSAFVGGTIGHLEGPDIAVTAVWGLAAGMLAAFGTGTLAVGLQAVVGLVVFSQFALSPGLAAVEGALVLAGGGVQALMVAVLWPLRRFPAERRALGAAFEQLADYAGSLPAASAVIGDPSYLEDALKALRDPQPFATREQMLAYQALGDQAERVRLELARLSEGRRRLADLGQVSYVGDLDAAATAVGVVLREVAASLRGGRAPQGLDDTGRSLAAIVSRLRADAGADAKVLDLWRRAAVGEAAHGAEALAGQLRAVVRLAAVPASSDPAPLAEQWWAGLVAAGQAVRGPRSRRATLALSTLHDVWEQLLANLDPSSQAARHAVRLATALVAAVALSHVFREGHGYWLPLTVVLVLRADFITTFTRGLARSVGTVAGAGLVTLLLAEARPGHAALIILTLALYWVAVAILFANYAAFSVIVAALVVTLLAFTGAPAPALAADRSLYTVLG
ncbi:MAG: FUSC family protein, partial [Acidimicrobiales bacterium]